jgi:hemolysin D
MAQHLRRLPPSDARALQAINDFQSETAAIIGAPDPLKARLVLHVLAAMVVVALTLASVIKIERVVTANGRVVSEAPKLLVQPLDTSIVRAIPIREGQVVKKGDILATLDPTFQTADVGALRAQAASLKSEIARLEAEQKGEAFAGPESDPNMALQLSIWRSRQAEYNARMVGFRQKMDSDQSTVVRAQQDAKHYRSRLGLASEVEHMRKELESKQVGSRLNSLIASDSRVEIARNLAEAENTIQTATHDMEAERAERDVFVQQWKSAIAKDLVDRRGQYDKVRQDLAKAERRQEMVELRAASDGIVLEVGKFSIGSVVQPGDQVMTLVPIGSGLSIDADIDAADQGFVAPGQKVNVKFAAYRYIDHGMGHGEVRTISADSFALQDSKAESPNRFYRARIDVTDLPLRDVPKDFRLVPGMTLTADIVVGRRTIIAYILEGALRNLSEGMREP